MKRVLNALDKTILEKVRFNRAYKLAKIESRDIIRVSVGVTLPVLPGITPKELEAKVSEKLKLKLRESAAELLWDEAEKHAQFFAGECRARADIFLVKTSGEKFRRD